jgi:hypothetical protein
MSIKIYSGKIRLIGAGSSQFSGGNSHLTVSSVVEIGDHVLKKIGYRSYIESYLNIGSDVDIAVIETTFYGNWLCAMRLPDGRVIHDEVTYILVAILYFLIGIPFLFAMGAGLLFWLYAFGWLSLSSKRWQAVKMLKALPSKTPI